MSRKPDPENVYLARRAAVLSILTGSGMPADMAEARVAAWEADATARGSPRHEATFWEGAAEWTVGPEQPFWCYLDAVLRGNEGSKSSFSPAPICVPSARVTVSG